ncbi:hypothetical protein J4411_02405 [Candidatus Pacearchaeota archaeon]|nr:hypothetical protein [Candidatus Pacearchaeota archaeon]
MKKNFLYHGSTALIEDYLVPKKANDSRNIKENNLTAVYATDIKDLAIVMGFLKSVKPFNLLTKLVLIEIEEDLVIPKGIVYGKEYTLNEKIYLYILPRQNFLKCVSTPYQYVSEKLIKPLETIEISLKNYKKSIRPANKVERFFQFFKNDIH